MKKAKLVSLSKIKKALYADWSLRVRTRDGFKCLLCGATENLTAHHWYCSDHHAHAARYAVDNGATLCYACHIRGVHSRADYVSVRKIKAALRMCDFDTNAVETLINTELTTALLRELWDAMRRRPVVLGTDYISYSYKKGDKYFLKVVSEHPIAVVGNTIREIAGVGLCEVTAVTKIVDTYRYTLKKPEVEV